MKPTVKTFIHQKGRLFSKTNVFGVKLIMAIILIVSSLSIPFTNCYGQKVVKASKGDVDIVSPPQDKMEPEPRLGDHKQFDVEIFRLTFDEPFMGKGKQVYSIRYYLMGRNDSLTYSKAWIGTDDNYDKAAYQWANDSTVDVIMFNSITAIADTVELYSSNGSSGIITKD